MELEQFNSVRIIIDYMYKLEMEWGNGGMGQIRYDMMMRSLLLAIEKEGRDTANTISPSSPNRSIQSKMSRF